MDSPWTVRCGICALPAQAHTIVRWAAGYSALCSATQMSDIADQDVLRAVAEGMPR